MTSLPFSRFSDYFMAVAKYGSLRQAADQLYISVSAVHRQIDLAEEQLGIALFERLATGLKLTLAGELLYADLLRWQKEFQLTCTRFDEIQGLKRGSIDFGLVAALSDGFIAEVMQNFNAEYPWIDFNLHIYDSDTVAQKVMNAELDFGFVINPKIQHHLNILSFIDLPLGFVMSKHHPLAQHELFHLSESLHDHHILPARPLVIHEYAQAFYKQHQFSPQRKTECNDIRMIISLIQHNLGIGILSYLDVYPLLQQQQLVFQPIFTKQQAPVTLALAVAPKRQLSRIAQLMMNQMIEKMEQLKIN